MAVRQKLWDKHEAVILLEGYFDMTKKSLPRNDVIARVSDELRNMAIHQGYKIDDIFRNKNGIAFQLKSMESAVLGYNTAMPASKLFIETVALYKNDPNEYAKLREEARNMIDGTKTFKQKYMAYLASQVSHAQFTELSSYYPDIEAFCKKLNILKKPLFETTDFDTIKRVQKVIEQDKIFRITHKKNYARIVVACRYYYVYIRDGLFESPNSTVDATQAPLNAEQSTIEVEPIEPDKNKDAQSALKMTRNDVQKAPVSSSQNLEAMVYEALRAETEGKRYGTTISFLQSQVHRGNYSQIKAILDNAEWAKFQFGQYFFVSKESFADERKEKVMPTSKNGPDIPLERTEEDRRLQQKYPVIYKRLFSSLYEITESQPQGATVAELFVRISQIGRPAVIEEILDNVSWASSDENRYIFSTQVVDHSVVIEDTDEISSAENVIPATPSEGIYLVDFNGRNDLAYTKPVSFSYFGAEKVANFSWSDLYVFFFSTIRKDFPHIFRAGMSFSKNKGRVDLAETGSVMLMKDPKPVPETSFLIETNLSASDIVSKIKFILDLCDIDYEKVIIKYKKKDSSTRSRQRQFNAKPITLSASSPLKEISFNAFSNYLSKTLQLSESTAYNYANAICVCESIAREQHYNNWHLYSEDLASVIDVIRRLKTDPEFLDRNRNRHQLSAALTKYEQFLADENVSYRAALGSCEHTSGKNAEPYKNEHYEAVLSSSFKKGFRLDSPLEIRKFRRYYSSVHGVELADSDEVISATIMRLCITYEGKAYLPAVMLSDELKDKLFRYIENSFASGKKAIYFQAIYTEFAEDFLDYPIHDAEMLKVYLTFVADGRFYINRDCISKQPDVTLDPKAEIRSYLQDSGRPIEYEELFAALPHLPQDKIKNILGTNSEFIHNGHGAYFHESTVVLSNEELEKIALIISNTIEEKDYMGGNELYDAIKAKYPYIIERNHFCSVYGFRDALKYKLGDCFSFKGNIISKAGQEMSMADIFANYAKHHDSFTLTELQALATDLATVIYFDSVYENCLRISRDQFVSKRHAQFPIADTDAAIDRVCTGKYISIQAITNFGIFPYVGFPWNSYLLEHYVAEYSHKYMLLHSNYSGTECAGAIVKRSAGINSFDDFIVDLLANNEVELQKASALQFLADNGYLARRRYSNIESLIIKANAQRRRKDID